MNYKTKNKRTKDMHIRLTEREQLKLLLLCGAEYSIAEKIRYYINSNFYNVYNTNDIEIVMKKENRDLYEQYKNQKEKEELTNESKELEELKAARRAKKVGVAND